LGVVLDTALRLLDHKELRFILVGDGPEKASLQEKAHSLALDNVQFHDPVPRQKMPEVIAAADICLIPLKTYLPGAVPSKLYEAMACAKPVILIAEGEAAEIVARHRSGIIVNPGDTGGLTEAVCFLACNPAARHEMGTNGRRAVENNYDRSMIVEGFATFLEGKNPDGLVSDRSTTSKAN
jgi:glycosyltransferase involved in cell wall biosynthesis